MGWKFNQEKPIYLQIINLITIKILAGDYHLGQQIESVRELADIAGVNPNTMQKSLQEMERIGILHSKRTLGRFVTEDIDVLKKTRDKILKEKIGIFLFELKKLGYSSDEIINFIKEAEGNSEYNFN